MNLKEMKKKFKSGEYILLWKEFKDLKWVVKGSFHHDNRGYNKLIHKKHKHILDAYLKDNGVQLFITYKNSDVGAYISGDNFIENYDENAIYELKETNMPQKNNFHEYGFETDFEAEIYKTDEYGNLIGVAIGFVTAWDSLGNCLFSEYTSDNEELNLTPLKKEWYDVEDNFPCLCLIKSKSVNNSSFVVIDDINEYKSYLKIFEVRPATKEEILSLLVKE